jgi:ABC-type microcin C transport system permease subunit YejB
MLTFILRRLLWSVPLLLGVMLLTFIVMRGAGGSPFRNEFDNLPVSLQISSPRSTTSTSPGRSSS